MPGHLTASAWVTYPPTDEVLLTHHRKLDKWLQLGGHADGDPDLGRVARTEVLEESGIRELESVRPGGAPHLDTGSMPAIFDLDIHEVPAFGGVPAHLHYDVRCAFVAARRSEPVVSHESHDVAWVRLDRLEDYTVEPSMMRMREKWWGTRPRRPASASRTTD
jgi:8-oxo-dGTP pyrophosphatase MutT (NUDIX family)